MTIPLNNSRRALDETHLTISPPLTRDAKEPFKLDFEIHLYLEPFHSRQINDFRDAGCPRYFF